MTSHVILSLLCLLTFAGHVSCECNTTKRTVCTNLLESFDFGCKVAKFQYSSSHASCYQASGCCAALDDMIDNNPTVQGGCTGAVRCAAGHGHNATTCNASSTCTLANACPSLDADIDAVLSCYEDADCCGQWGTISEMLKTSYGCEIDKTCEAEDVDDDSDGDGGDGDGGDGDGGDGGDDTDDTDDDGGGGIGGADPSLLLNLLTCPKKQDLLDCLMEGLLAAVPEECSDITPEVSEVAIKCFRDTECCGDFNTFTSLLRTALQLGDCPFPSCALGEHKVRVPMEIPTTKAAFEEPATLLAFRRGMADVGQVTLDKCQVVSVTEKEVADARRHLLATAVDVVTELSADSADAASAVSTRISSGETALKAAVQAATGVEPTSVSAPTVAGPASEVVVTTPPPNAAGVCSPSLLLGSAVLLALAGAGMRW